MVEAARNEESQGAALQEIPSWFPFGTEEQDILAAVQRFMAER